MTDRPQHLRAEISDSWHRSAATGVRIDLPAAPVLLDDVALERRRGNHPLSRVQPLLEDVLGQAVRDCGAVLALGDADGHLLWVTGTGQALRRAERIGFVAGSNWDERFAGTNAPGTALRLDIGLVVRGGEHYLDAVRAWNCAAIPIHDPATGSVLGVLDVTGGEQIAVPQTLAMIRAAARMAETELTRTLPATPRPEGPADFVLEALGRTEAVLVPTTDRARAVRLGPRHSEMLVLLATHPGGLTGTELAELVYPHRVSPATVRAEVNRLRALVGADVLESRPYRLRARISGDWSLVECLLAAGDVEGALRCYRGRLLPRSTSPAVEALADDLEWSLRAAVLDSGRLDLMASWTRTAEGADDLEMWTAQAQRLPATSALRPLVTAQVSRLDRELAAPTPPRHR
ncbi:hypothetical protein GA0111570_1163 [Raineyella antarctica]|uniref:OmpR/PhoB-type domain-containing protein n=1 Tax=Raineyella antarctica TaxID=1577474 RepID=A0A1G6IEF3_9ACTN|nr:helix-turn-helix domain-containing protein [Raineyella antarctica]SDC04854.1 hypothetical protein GA0111570_1163 [Raineyella antarctica]